MRYEEYEKKIVKRANTYKKLYGLRFVFLGAFFAIVITASSFVFSKGVTFNNKKIKKTFVYGETLTYKSVSFLSKTVYEFSEEGKNNWSTKEPYKVGKYKLRAKAKNSFSSYYTSASQRFEIVPREIEVPVYEQEITYGETPSIRIGDSLFFDDQIVNDYQFTYDDITSETWKITPVKESVHFVSKTGEDISYCYTVKPVTTDVKILKRRIAVSTGSASKTYDGEELSNTNFEVSVGSLVDGDTISLKDYTSVVSAGNHNNNHSYTIKNKDGIDMTNHYDIVLSPGTLAISKRDATFSSDDVETTYNGLDKRFDLSDINYDTNDIVTGEQVVFDYISEEENINVGEYENSFKVKIISGDVDVTDNYNITCNFGTTTVKKREITVESPTVTKTYDGLALKSNSFDITTGSLATKDELAVTYNEFIDAGEYENEMVIAINDKKTKQDVISNYDVTLVNGDITINKRELGIAITQKTVTYDGLPHKNEYVVETGVLAGEDYLEEVYNVEKTDVGTYSNDDFELMVKTSEGIDNSKNYSLTYTGQENSLIINKRQISIETISKEKLYDELPMYKTLAVLEDTHLYDITDGTLAMNEYIDYSYTNNEVDAGAYPIVSELKIYHQVGEVQDTSKDIDVTSNYDIDLTIGNFVIDKRTLVIQTEDISHIYDRKNVLTQEENYYSITTTSDGLVTGHKIAELGITCSAVNVGEYDYIVNPDDFWIKNASGIDVTKNYDVTFINNGKVTINQRPINVTMTENSRVYDGTPFISEEHEVTNLVDDDYLTFDDLPNMIHATTHPLGSTVINQPGQCHVLMNSGEEVTSNYSINFVNYGSIHVEPRPISISSPSSHTTFDGQFISKMNELSIDEGSLADGDTLIVTSLYSRDNDYLHAGTYYNYYDYRIENNDGLDVTADYNVQTEIGVIEIDKRELYLGVIENKNVYDGLTHNYSYDQNNVTASSENIYIGQGSMPDGIILEAHLYFNNLVNVGKYAPTGSALSLHADVGYEHDLDLNDFNIEIAPASHEIITRNITISSLGGDKIYDGNPFGYGLSAEDLVWISSGGLAPGDYIASYNSISMVAVGSYTHEVNDLIIRNAYDDDVTSNYHIQYKLGKVNIHES